MTQPPKVADSTDDDGEREIIEIRFGVEKNCDGWRLDRYLQLRLKRLSRTRVTQIIRACASLNGVRVRKPGVRVRPGDEILLERPAPIEPDVPRHFALLAEGPGWLAVDKPSGLPVHPSSRYLKNTLTALIKERFGENSGVNMAHRLDRETSGVVIFGTDGPSTRALKSYFRDKRVRKRYLAIVHGDLKKGCTVDAALGPAPGSAVRVRMGVVPGGQAAKTEFEPLERFGSHSLVEARPHTGRQHQIRVHLEHLGHPVVGDKLYGHPDRFFLELIERGLDGELPAELELPRHALHAAGLRCPSPRDPESELAVSAPLPQDLEAYLAALRQRV